MRAVRLPEQRRNIVPEWRKFGDYAWPNQSRVRYSAQLGAYVTRGRHPSDKAAAGNAASPADGRLRLRPVSRRMMTRMLPGGVMVAAALTMPEFSVGAGDMGRGPEPADPPEPAARPDPAKPQRIVSSVAPTHSKLAGVRYGAVIDLGTDTGHVAARVRAQAPRPDGVLERNAAETAASHAAFAQAFAAPATPIAAPAGSAPAIESQPAAAAIPQIASALIAAPSAASSADLPAASEMPEPPSKPAVAEADALAFANLLPEEQTALRAPAGTGAVPAVQTSSQPLSQPVSRPAPAPAAVAAPAPAPAAALAPVSAQPAPRGMIDQVTPARIAAARVAAAPAPAPAPAPASAPAPAAVRAAAPSAPAPAPKAATLAAAAPAARAPAAAVPAAKPATPPAAAATVVPKQAPALTAPPAAAGASPRIADLEFKSRLLTRVDGRTRGQVDFQQTAAGLKVRLGSVAEVLADRLPAGELARIRGSSSADAWLSLAELQAQGIPISYDPVYDEFNIGREDTRPRAARKVHIDQISTPERSDGAAAMDQIRRR